MIKNEKGLILPLTLVISLITASLLITISHRLESQAHSYAYRFDFQKGTSLEKECIELILDSLADPDFSVPSDLKGSLTLHDGTMITLKYTNGMQSLVINYKFSYNSYHTDVNITYNKKQHTYTLG